MSEKSEKVRILEDRRERLLAKLEQRNVERKVGAEGANSKVENEKLDILMSEIRKELDEKHVDPQKIDHLQEFLAFSSSNRQTKAIQNVLEDVRKFKLTLKPASKFTGFAFAKPKSTQIAQQPAENAAEASSSAGLSISAEIPSSSENVIEELKNAKKCVKGRNGEDISLKNVENCRLQFDFEPSVVYLRNIKNSTLIFLRCDRSVLMYDCENVHIFVAAQQVRIHTSQSVHLHVATRGAVILEDSNAIFMYPYRLKSAKSGVYFEAEDNGEWKSPRDFNWLAKTPSPNWHLVPEDQWTEEIFE
ncbi:unnamed protein product [Caenorhabditis sp. 36 PRJEB53466]|nr:unnamed protein product [Caenorhabditis sp. 36 PRJEB53466]